MSRSVGIVVIGRNEGARLNRCLRSIEVELTRVVYVDSGSTDGSVTMARDLGVHVLGLDLSTPFTAGRARNFGFSFLRSNHPDLAFVQFVDGDCELEPGWLAAAEDFLVSNPDVASVCGRRRERFPDASIYNRLCDIEWDTPVGYASATGGDFMVSVGAFERVNGFNESLIAGEEPELGHRLQKSGWRIYRMDRAMTVHDAAMRSISQWFVRNSRAGYAYAARAMLHVGDGSRLCWRENLSSVVWGGLLPVTVVGLLMVDLRASVAAACLLGMQVLRVAHRSQDKLGRRLAFVHALFLQLGKFAEFVGQLRFLGRWATGAEQRIIEYK